MNGGVSVFLCETSASIVAVASVDLTEFSSAEIEINDNNLRKISKGQITIETKPLYNGRTLTVWNVEITNDKGKLICTSRCSILMRKGTAVAK